jgi:hypothetical protein
MSGRLLLSAFVGGILLCVAGWLLWAKLPEPERSAAELMDVVMWGRESVGGPFALIQVDSDNRKHTRSRHRSLDRMWAGGDNHVALERHQLVRDFESSVGR